MSDDDMRQVAPYPTELADLVANLRYRPGWTFWLGHLNRGQGSEGLTLDIVTHGYNAYHPERGQGYDVHHYMPVPPAAYNRRSWQHWLFDQLLLVERHECCEFFALAVPDEWKSDAERLLHPYAPIHAPGNDPYIVHEYAEDIDRRTSFRGTVKPLPGD